MPCGDVSAFAAESESSVDGLVGQIRWGSYLPGAALACRWVELESERAAPSRTAAILGISSDHELALASALGPAAELYRERAMLRPAILAALRVSLEGGPL